MSSWILVLFIFTSGDPTPKGVTLGGLTTLAECEHRAQQDTKRVNQTNPQAEQMQWECIERRSKPASSDSKFST